MQSLNSPDYWLENNGTKRICFIKELDKNQFKQFSYNLGSDSN